MASYRRERRRKRTESKPNPPFNDDFERPSRSRTNQSTFNNSEEKLNRNTKKNGTYDDDKKNRKTYSVKTDDPPPSKEQSLDEAIKAARESAAQARHYAQYGTMAPLTSPVKRGQPLIVVSPPTMHHQHEDELQKQKKQMEQMQQMQQMQQKMQQMQQKMQQQPKKLERKEVPVKRVVHATKSVPKPRLPPPRSSNPNNNNHASSNNSLTEKSQQIADLLARASSLRNDSKTLLDERQKRQQKVNTNSSTALVEPTASMSSSPSSSSSISIIPPPSSPSAPSTLSSTEETFRNIQVAANKGNDGAQFQMGLTYEKGLHNQSIDYVESIRWYSLSASQNNSRSLCNLGRMYQLGHGTEPDDAVAVRYFQKGSLNKDAKSKS
jgi:hypothetical protein